MIASELWAEWADCLKGDLKANDAQFKGAAHEERLHGYINALGIVVDALKTLPGFDAEMLAFKDLAARLDGLASGQKSALLPVSRHKGGRPEYSTSDWITVGKAAAVVSFLIDRGTAEPNACEKVAKALRAYTVRGRRGDELSADTIREWRSMATRHDNNTEAPEAYRRTLSMLQEVTPAGLSTVQINRVLAATLKPFKSASPN